MNIALTGMMNSGQNIFSSEHFEKLDDYGGKTSESKSLKLHLSTVFTGKNQYGKYY